MPEEQKSPLEDLPVELDQRGRWSDEGERPGEPSRPLRGVGMNNSEFLRRQR
ncbi:MAG: hypothetical protein ACREFQ_04025 [Stellaceae bacterium]